MYLASLGEIALIASLWYFAAALVKHHALYSTFGSLLVIALLFISFTASIGVFRFAGMESIKPMHDLTSLISKQFAMVVYAFSALLLLANGKYQRLGLSLFLLIFCVNSVVFMSASELPGIITDAFIFVAFVLLGLSTGFYRQTAIALIILLLVPATALITYSEDVKMAVFHLLLAGHFYLIKGIVIPYLKTENSDEPSSGALV